MKKQDFDYMDAIQQDSLNAYYRNISKTPEQIKNIYDYDKMQSILKTGKIFAQYADNARNKMKDAKKEGNQLKEDQWKANKEDICDQAYKHFKGQADRTVSPTIKEPFYGQKAVDEFNRCANFFDNPPVGLAGITDILDDNYPPQDLLTYFDPYQ